MCPAGRVIRVSLNLDGSSIVACDQQVPRMSRSQATLRSTLVRRGPDSRDARRTEQSFPPASGIRPTPLVPARPPSVASSDVAKHPEGTLTRRREFAFDEIAELRCVLQFVPAAPLCFLFGLLITTPWHCFFIGDRSSSSLKD